MVVPAAICGVWHFAGRVKMWVFTVVTILPMLLFFPVIVIFPGCGSSWMLQLIIELGLYCMSKLKMNFLLDPSILLCCIIKGIDSIVFTIKSNYFSKFYQFWLLADHSGACSVRGV